MLLLKDVMYPTITTRRFFYSPWRRSLRPLRGILRDLHVHYGGDAVRGCLRGHPVRQGMHDERAGLSPRAILRRGPLSLSRRNRFGARYSLKDLSILRATISDDDSRRQTSGEAIVRCAGAHRTTDADP
ncbi:MAG: hypothetical protein IPM88_21055 [Nitrospira sp.]|nr:hypothetical protein [Nitrospira sp.]